jgi:non-specific serine/threonine protein kinase/serine/threonine-protein kinase
VNPQVFQHVKELFEEALRLLPDQRSAFLAARAATPEVRAEVESLISVYEESPDFLEGATPRIPDEAETSAPAAPLEGRRIGAWRLVREIGKGGMGVVWEAQRADLAYEQRVALKLLPAGLLSSSGIARFREERQILARLNHPGIARLLDGGATEDGSPYLVMEYVEGQPLDLWCETQKPALRERLKLFLSICAAVEYAHRHLVIHRDLKPANILVTPEGSPKLLDFGIAKLLDPASASPGEFTRPGERLLTPGYASPEQVRGEAATTASDVYSLGVLLYLLLTGQRPFAQYDQDPLALIRAVFEQDPAPPSALAGPSGSLLRGELDAIVLQAVRKNPDERYVSARALADDLTAWLDGRPVSAHPQPPWQRASKFIRRHKTQSVAAALALVSLVAGSAVSLWQAHAAHLERARAESRFRQVRQFSRSVLFELHEAIRNLPGATPARNLLLARATEFLDALATDPGRDAALLTELAEGYRSLGHVQGSSFSDNLGQRDAAIASFQKAARLATQALAASPQDAGAELALLGVYDDLTTAYFVKGDFSQADAYYDRHRDLLARVAQEHPTEQAVMLSAASSYSALAYYRAQRNDLSTAKQYYRKAIELFATLPSSREFEAQYPFALKRLGAILITENSLDEAERLYRTALAIEDAALAAGPADARLRIDRTFTLSDLALILKKRNDFPKAARIYEDVVTLRKAARNADPGNLRFLSLTASAELNLAGVYSKQKRHLAAIQLCRDAVALRDRGASTQAHQDLANAATARVILAFTLLDAAQDSAPSRRGNWLSEAALSLRQAASFVDRLPTTNLSRSDQALLADYGQARERLRRLSPQP